MDSQITPRLALISVSDKTGLIPLAETLVKHGVKIIATGGTLKHLISNGILAEDVTTISQQPEMLAGRVKTLNGRIFAGILAKRNDGQHCADLADYNIPQIDLVIVNLYPFEKTIAKRDCTLATAIENIDIGGVALLRAAAKNFADVVTVSQPAQYSTLINELNTNNGNVSLNVRKQFAIAAFKHVTDYDCAISEYIESMLEPVEELFFPNKITLQYDKIQDLRYGENPHQIAAFYRNIEAENLNSIIAAKQLHGKELSYNNILDAESAWSCISFLHKSLNSFINNKKFCVIVKHNNPCGAAFSVGTQLNAYEKAYKCDPVSAFGGIIAFNTELDKDTATKIIANQFVEVIIAPVISSEVVELFAKKPNIRLLQMGECYDECIADDVEIRHVTGGLLVQSVDNHMLEDGDMKLMTRKSATYEQLDDMRFAWIVAKYVKSNAIVFVKDGATLGIGAGQMSRVDSTRLAVSKANCAKLDLEGSIVASDAFFPFRDGVEEIYRAGAAAIIQPGGSVKDNEVIQAANEFDAIMVFTGIRHFRH